MRPQARTRLPVGAALRTSYRTQLAVVLLALCVGGCASSGGDRLQSPTALPHVSPAAAGYSEEGLAKLRTVLAESGSDGLILLHKGQIFFQWGDTHKKQLVHSIRKPILSSLYGACAMRRTIPLDATLASLDIDDAPNALTAEERGATLRHVLQSRSGVFLPAAAESEGMAATRPARGSHLPGGFYYYNNWDFNVAGHIFEARCGSTIYDAFERDIARPLGLADYAGRIGSVKEDAGDLSEFDGFYQFEPSRSRFPAYHFRLSAYDLALIGQLFLQRGQWHGKQIVSADWIDQSTAPVSITDKRFGLAYGMLWDVLLPESPDERPSFFHTGVGVHMLGVYPKHDLVMVHRVASEKPFKFNEGDLYRVIRTMHAARNRSKEASK